MGAARKIKTKNIYDKFAKLKILKPFDENQKSAISKHTLRTIIQFVALSQLLTRKIAPVQVACR